MIVLCRRLVVVFVLSVAVAACGGSSGGVDASDNDGDGGSQTDNEGNGTVGDGGDVGESACDPNCEGRTCGDDGCGGSCGDGCAAGFTCSAEGQCTDVRECKLGTHDCHENAVCLESAGGFSCQCNTGFVGDGRECVDVDECSTALHMCSSNALCDNLVGGYTCTCNAGFSGNGISCSEVISCMVDNGGCDANARCSRNSQGKIECDCKSGFSGGGVVCVDVDECLFENGGCDVNANCVDADIPGLLPTCTCKSGFTGDGLACANVDECQGGHDCHANATCSDSLGSFTCACGFGFVGDGKNCQAGDQCTVGGGDCGQNAACTDQNGVLLCLCDAGFSGDGISCVDVNECDSAGGGCGENSSCENTPGSFLCVCDEGYAVNSLGVCVLVPRPPAVGELIITEFMVNPEEVDDAGGEWVEVFNLSGSTLELSGLVLRDDSQDYHEIAPTSSLLIGPQQYLLLGSSGDLGGGLVPDYVYSSDDFELAEIFGDEIILEDPAIPAIIIDMVAYGSGVSGNDIHFPQSPGASIRLNPSFFDAFDNDTGLNWCAGATEYNGTDLGSPGAANGDCSGASRCLDLVVQGENGIGADHLVLSEVQPGLGGFIEFFNPTFADIVLEQSGYELCWPFNYTSFRDDDPGTLSTTIPALGFATISWPVMFQNADSGDGELLLYRGVLSTGDFGNSEKIVDFVCWGTGTRRRKTQAENGGSWGGDCLAPIGTGATLQRIPMTSGDSAGDYDINSRATPQSCAP